MTTVGYPVHAVKTYSIRHTQYAVQLTKWEATCGAIGEQVGTHPFGTVTTAGRRELCKACWPAGHQTYHPKAEEK
jgi:hypothetical protein